MASAGNSWVPIVSAEQNRTKEVIAHTEVIVDGNGSPELADAIVKCRCDQVILDLVRLPVCSALLEAGYRGICW